MVWLKSLFSGFAPGMTEIGDHDGQASLGGSLGDGGVVPRMDHSAPSPEFTV